jgi:hypothetical protein
VSKLNFIKSAWLLIFLLALGGCEQKGPWTTGYPAGQEKIEVHPMVHFGPLDQNAVWQLRREAVSGEPLLKPLLAPGYDPANTGTWNVTEKPTWYGVEGFLFGYTELWRSQHDEGHSLASAWLLNPWLLAMPFSLNRYMALDRNQFSTQDVARWESEALPREILLDGPARKLTLKFRRSQGDAYERRLVELNQRNDGSAKFALNMVNARDLGLGAYAVLKSGTSNASFQSYDKITENLQNLRQRILHLPKNQTDGVLDLEGWNDQTANFNPQGLPYTITLGFWPKLEGARLDQPALKVVLECDYNGS